MQLHYYIVDRGESHNLIELNFFGKNTKGKVVNTCLNKSMRFCFTKAKGISFHNTCRNGNTPDIWDINAFGLKEAKELILKSGVTFKSGKTVQGTVELFNKNLKILEENNMNTNFETLRKLVDLIASGNSTLSQEVCDNTVNTFLRVAFPIDAQIQPTQVVQTVQECKKCDEVSAWGQDLKKKYNALVEVKNNLMQENEELKTQVSVLTDMVSKQQEETTHNNVEDFIEPNSSATITSVEIQAVDVNKIVEIEGSYNIDTEKANEVIRAVNEIQLINTAEEVFTDEWKHFFASHSEDFLDTIMELSDEGKVSDDEYDMLDALFHVGSTCKFTACFETYHGEGIYKCKEFVNKGITIPEGASQFAQYIHAMNTALTKIVELLQASQSK